MSTLVTSRNGIQRTLLWAAIIVLGAVSLGIVALSRCETISAAWLVIAALCVYFVAYRFYALFIAVAGYRSITADPYRALRSHWTSLACSEE